MNPGRPAYRGINPALAGMTSRGFGSCRRLSAHAHKGGR